MDIEDDMVDYYVTMQASYIDCLVEKITELENELEQRQKEEQQHSEAYQNDYNLNELKNQLTEYEQRIDSLTADNERLTTELNTATIKVNEMKQKQKEEEDGNVSIQKQSIDQIKQLGDKNKELESEITKLRMENSKLSKQIESQPTSNKEQSENEQLKKTNSTLQIENKQLNETISTLQIENEQLKETLNTLKKKLEESEKQCTHAELQEQTPKSSVKPIQENGVLFGFNNDLDINVLSESQLRYQLQSEHNQLESTTRYLREIETQIDQYAQCYLNPLDVPPITEATHDKLKKLVTSLVSSQQSNRVESEPSVSQENWKEAYDQSQIELQYLHHCNDIVEKYLIRLVGKEVGANKDYETRLKERFDLVCKRSEKLLNEFRIVQKQVETNPSYETLCINDNLMTTIVQHVQDLAIHMHVITPSSRLGCEDVVTVIDRIDTILVNNLPGLADKINKYKERYERERQGRKTLQEKIRQIERRNMY